MRAIILRSAFALACLAPAAPPAVAQGADQERAQRFESIPWEAGPTRGDLGDQAEVRVPAACRFTQADGARTFMELTENPPDGSERGVIVCPDSAETSLWFVVFSYSDMGYVKDDERDQLDADKILASLREGTDAGNRERRDRGWETITLEGWVRPPYYDTLTNNLTWATMLSGEQGGRSVNHSVRLLGRGGVMYVDLVIDPEQMTSALPVFDSIIATYTYKSGHRYAEWRQGDRVAAYGLTALIAGGAGAVAAKTGLLAKFWKAILAFLAAAWKLVLAVVAAIGVALKRLFGRRESAAESSPPTETGRPT
jgi:uncharacterized membrane-anchored protein